MTKQITVRRRTKTPLQDLRLDELHPSPLNPRGPLTGPDVDGTEDPDLGDLADSIRDVGLLQPIVVRPREAGGYEIVCGHRRSLAAQLAELTHVPCMVRELDDRHALEAMLVENSQRRDVPLLAEADALARLVEMGANTADLVDRMGRSRKWARDRLALRSLRPALRELVGTGALALRSGVILSRLSPERQERIEEDALRYAKTWGHVTHGQVQRWVCGHHLANAPWSLEDDTLDPGHRGACADCTHRTDRQADLFDRSAEGGHCLDVACWRARAASYAEREKAGGRQVVLGRQPDYDEGLRPDVMLFELKDDDGECRALTELVPEVETTLYVDEEGRTSARATPEAAAAALRKAGYEAMAERVEERAVRAAGRTSTTASSRPAPPKPDKAKVLEALGDLVEDAEAAVRSLEVDLAGALELRDVVRLVMRTSNAMPLALVAKRRGVERAELEEACNDVSGGQTAATWWGLLLELLVAAAVEPALGPYYHLEAEHPVLDLMRWAKVPVPEHLTKED